MKEDARTLSATAQEEKRKQAVRLRKKGLGYREIGELVGVHDLTVGRWIRAYQSGGASALKSQSRGRRSGTGRGLSLEQESLIQKRIMDKTPDQLKLAYALWARQAVLEIIKRETGIKLAIRTVGKYLSLWEFIPQKPLEKAYEQSPTQVKKWLEKNYPEIKAQAKLADAEIYWGDETGIRNNAQHERDYAPRGKTPIIRLNAKQESTNMVSAINNQGKVRFQVYGGNMNADVLIDFMKRLTKDAERKVYLILDNLRVHHAKVVKAWLENNREKIEVFYLPKYSPELNPDEYLTAI
jgi:transposase